MVPQYPPLEQQYPEAHRFPVLPPQVPAAESTGMLQYAVLIGVAAGAGALDDEETGADPEQDRVAPVHDPKAARIDRQLRP